jgi:hypothetical protein
MYIHLYICRCWFKKGCTANRMYVLKLWSLHWVRLYVVNKVSSSKPANSMVNVVNLCKKISTKCQKQPFWNRFNKSDHKNAFLNHFIFQFFCVKNRQKNSRKLQSQDKKSLNGCCAWTSCGFCSSCHHNALKRRTQNTRGNGHRNCQWIRKPRVRFPPLWNFRFSPT